MVSMDRNISKFTEQLFDVVVIGGGIHGAAISNQLARVGLKTALLEKDDFSNATSANSLKILHGGLRYLQHFNFQRMRESIVSRRAFIRLAPYLVKPLACIMPTYGIGLQGKFIMGLALLLNDIISFDRNRGIDTKRHLLRGKIISRSECLQIAPGVAKDGLTGAALWYDAVLTNTERMVLVLLKKAVSYGACVINYVKAEQILYSDNSVQGIMASDTISGRRFQISCKLVVNAAGPWVDELIESVTDEKHGNLAKAVNIVINKKLFSDYAVGLAGTSGFVDKDAVVKRGKRLFFFVPWQGKTIVGTTYKHYVGDKDIVSVQKEEQLDLLNEVNAIYPSAKLSLEDVTFCHAGLVPSRNDTPGQQDSEPQLLKHSRIVDHEKMNGLKGILSIKGVKYTTAIEVAQQVQALIVRKKLFPMQTVNKCISKKQKKDEQSACSSQDMLLCQKQYDHLEASYGESVKDICKIIQEDKSAGQYVYHDPPLIKAEIIYAIQDEMAIRLSDVVFRRTNIGSAGYPGKDILHKIACIMAEQLGWNEDEKNDQVENVVKIYQKNLAVMA